MSSRTGYDIQATSFSPARFARANGRAARVGLRTIGFAQWIDYSKRAHDRISRKAPDRHVRRRVHVLRHARLAGAPRARHGRHRVPRLRANRRRQRVGERRDQLPLLDATRILALQNEGVHFGSHSVAHRPLAHIPVEDARDELTRSRTQLGELLGRDVDVFAYPFSNQNGDVRDLAREAGYRCAVRGKGRMNCRAPTCSGCAESRWSRTPSVVGAEPAPGPRTLSATVR